MCKTLTWGGVEPLTSRSSNRTLGTAPHNPHCYLRTPEWWGRARGSLAVVDYMKISVIFTRLTWGFGRKETRFVTTSRMEILPTVFVDKLTVHSPALMRLVKWISLIREEPKHAVFLSNQPAARASKWLNSTCKASPPPLEFAYAGWFRLAPLFCRHQ